MLQIVAIVIKEYDDDNDFYSGSIRIIKPVK